MRTTRVQPSTRILASIRSRDSFSMVKFRMRLKRQNKCECSGVEWTMNYEVWNKWTMDYDLRQIRDYGLWPGVPHTYSDAPGPVCGRALHFKRSSGQVSAFLKRGKAILKKKPKRSAKTVGRWAETNNCHMQSNAQGQTPAFRFLFLFLLRPIIPGSLLLPGTAVPRYY